MLLPIILIVFFVSIFNKISHISYINKNFPKGSWVSSMHDPIYKNNYLCAYLYKIPNKYDKIKKDKWSCIYANLTTVLHNINGDFVYDCANHLDLCVSELKNELSNLHFGLHFNNY